MPRLIVLTGEEIGREYDLPAEAVLGRNAGCAVTISHASVSREHARIVAKEGDFVLTDLGSSNGTFVNGKKIQTATLHWGDEIQLGQFQLRFAEDRADVEVEEIRLEEGAPPSVAAVAPASTPVPAKKKISDIPVRPIAQAPARRGDLLGQDVSQYGGYYKFAILLAGLAIAAGIFLGVKYLAAKMAAKASISAEEENSDF